MIAIDSLSKSFGSHLVLNQIHCQFEPGKVYGIVGENGAGKTTLFRCIAGLEHYSGSITANQMPLKNHLGLLLTDPFFFPKITGREYLQLLCNARQKPLERPDERNIFDLPLDQYASTYSTGMKKKLALTGILLQENPYLILDEPFNGVDIQSNLILTEIILRLKSLGKIVLLSSHIFSTLRDTCDTIHLLQEGKISQTVSRSEFDQLEEEMKSVSIGDRIERLSLR
jgi:ABC-2 type transport system ATP-binding protein